MVDIGGKPILWHIMKLYSAFGVRDFIVCCGYKGYVIKEYFANYFLHNADVTFNMRDGTTEILEQRTEPWSVTLVDTGESSMTGGRLKRVRKYLGNDEPFCFTYGDGLSNIDITKLQAFHAAHGKLATVSAVRPLARFGALVIEDHKVTHFEEKPETESGHINGGFFILSPKVIDYVDDDAMIWEREPMERLAADGQLMAFEHAGFWQAMDTIRDKSYLEELWAKGNAPWRLWTEDGK
jgi:glucose-1-phosphate cytidylyltransferase